MKRPDPQEKLKLLIHFLELDISTALDEAIDEALTLKIRNRKGLERLAQEATVRINQSFLQVKREFGPGGEGREEDPEVAQKLLEEVNRLDAIYGIEGVTDLLLERLGIRAVEQAKEKVQELMLAARQEFLVAGSPRGELDARADQLARECKKELADRAAAAKERFGDQKAVYQAIIQDLKELRELIKDPEICRSKLYPL